jgi:hypothetical protein
LRIAVSGTHCSGKSTLIDEFLTAHPDFVHEPEPYTVMVEDYGEEFSSEPGADDFFRQLKFSVDRLRQHSFDEQVIYERCPVDFLAYIFALRALNREVVGVKLIEIARELVCEGMQHLDLVVFLPLDHGKFIDVPTEEDPILRTAVDENLGSLFSDDEFGVRSTSPAIVEVSGTSRERLQMLEDAIKRRAI